MTVKTRQVAFITGGARGIGFEIAAKLAQAGFDIALNDYQDSATLQASVARLEGWGECGCDPRGCGGYQPARQDAGAGGKCAWTVDDVRE